MPIELKDWGIVFLHIFQFDIQLFHHSSVLFDGQVQFSSIPIGFSRLRKAASFVCIKVVF